ncbi:bifunctional aspartate kinase/homoserine dehydrogenase II [Celerinatantimonas yamalensis]|uniref:Bifunctional aspartokinase/homoserine dehydrogenase n=1 Tax=Celerinatantimonas yamalensis TaxID=559956 RepID=A0ABW9G8R9_9GAMM
MSKIQRHVHKFGGSSLADASCFQRVVDILGKYSQAGDLIVVSAPGKTTNRLLEVLDRYEPLNSAAARVLESLISYHHELIAELLTGQSAKHLSEMLEQDKLAITRLLTQACELPIRHEVLSFGERWSARLLSSLLNQSELASDWLDSRDFLRAPASAQPQVDFQASQPLFAQQLAQYSSTLRLVVTGFIARDFDGQTITLGRNGSDYSATEIAALADAVHTTIWSDVAGIYSADPRKVREAKLLNKLALTEACELSRIGASVLHARSLEPLARSAQQLTLRSSYTPEEGSTQILRQTQGSSGARIVSTLDEVCLIDITFDGLPKSVQSLLHFLQQQQITPLTWQQRRDCHMLRLAYTCELFEQARLIVNQWASAHQFSVEGARGYSLLALVGRGVSEHANHSGQFYRLLARQPVAFIQQGPAHGSLIAVLPKTTLEPLLNELHQALFIQPRRMGLMVFGKGNIGQQWLRLFAHERAELERRYNLRLVLAGVFGRDGGVVDFHGLDPTQVLHSFQSKPVVWSELLERLAEHPFDEMIAIDMTASESISYYYPHVARLGLHLISANKYAGSADGAFYRQVQQAFADHGGRWLYNATVGAGLPIQSSINMLRDAGDHIQEISGIFSGTLSWLFQQFDGSQPFSQLLNQAWQQGLTEPDPREDLSGQDVQRKLLILAREAGYALEARQIELQSLVPASLALLSITDFMMHLNALDEAMNQALQTAQQQGLVLRYIARFNANGQAKVGVEMLPIEHPFANLCPCDNVFAIRSEWYQQNPLVIQGPGAGREVTAGAIQSDLVTLCQRLT